MNNKLARFVYLFFLLVILFQNLSSQLPPAIPPDNVLLKSGYLDVTLLGADSTGTFFSTQAIRDAVRLARDNNLVCYFPSGTYLVDDTIRCMKESVFENNKWKTVNHYCQIVGDPRKRPVIKLLPGASKYQDEENPLPVFWLYAMSAWGQQPECEGSTDPLCGQSNVSFNQMVKGLNFDLGRNPGAVAIRHPGAQGSTIEDVYIDARNAFAGIYNPPGQAGGTYNVEIEGGKYGIYQARVGGRYQSKFTIIAGCTFRNQEIAAINIDLSHPVVLVGFHIIQESGPVNRNLPQDGLSLIDGVIELSGGNIFHSTGRSLYLENVYVKGSTEVANGWMIDDPENWTHIQEYSYCNSGNSRNLINGSINTSQFRKKLEGITLNRDSLVQNTLDKHRWSNSDFPHFFSTATVNVKDPVLMQGNPAKGDGVSDDSDALEFAIANFQNVFLPKGNYTVSRTIKLEENTNLFGMSRTYTSIGPSDSWNGINGNALIETANDPAATTSLSFINVRSSGSHPLHWKAGSHSLVRSVNSRNVIINENGGGRWFALSNVGSQLKIEGTTQDLAMYATNPERASDPQYEIMNAENIRLFYVKTEAGTDGHSYMTSLRIRNSGNISVYGSTGNVQLNESGGLGMIEVINSDDVKVVHANPFKTGTNWFTLKEIYAKNVTGIIPGTKLAMYRRDRKMEGDTKYFDFDSDDPYIFYDDGIIEEVLNPHQDQSNLSDSAGIFISSEEAEPASIYDLPGYVDFSSGFVISMHILSDTTGTVRLNVSRRGIEDENLSLESSYTRPGNWEKLVFDLRKNLENKAVGEFYNRIYIDFDSDAEGERTWYFDDLYGPQITPVYYASALIRLKSEYTENGIYEIMLNNSGEFLKLYNDGNHGDEQPGDSIWSLYLPEISSGNYLIDIYADKKITAKGDDVEIIINPIPEKQEISLKHALFYAKAGFEVICTNPLIEAFEVVIDNSEEKYTLFNDGTHGDIIPNDSIWTNTTLDIIAGEYLYDIYANDELLPEGDDLPIVLEESEDLQIFSFHYETDLSLNSDAARNIYIYPNPVGDYLKILSNYSVLLKVRIMDITGKVLSEQGINTEGIINIEFGHLNAGLYFVEVVSENGQKAIFKVVKKLNQ
jgi:hypothetical protein